MGSLSTLQTRLYTRLRADQSSPSASDVEIDASSIATWANEVVNEVISFLPNEHIQQLMLIDESVSLNAGAVGSLPAGCQIVKVVKVGASKYKCRLFYKPEVFAEFDSSNFLLIPREREPLALISEGNVHVKPITNYASTTAYLDYIKQHPAISDSQATLLSDLGDTVLTLLIAEKYYNYMADTKDSPVWIGLAQKARKEALELANVANSRTNQG